ncbi:HLA class II histocompatibility antigen gamma chain isoform 2-T2 [Discoglossus pictus]
MTEETQNLVQEHGAEESVVHVEHREQRLMSCNKRSLVSALSVFVALLICGQAVMVYFITQQQSQITELDHSTKQLKLQNMIDKLPGSPPSQSQHKKLRMATFNIPLAYKDTDGSSDPQMTMSDLKKVAETSNQMEDAARYLLLKGNPLRTYPTFNGSIMDNLKQLKKSLSDQEWMFFDAWLQQWFLFYLVQNPTDSKTTPDPPVTAASVLTECQLLATGRRPHLGTYIPQCDEHGGFTPKQCWRSTGFCWCVYKNGTMIPNTETRGKVDCSGTLDAEASATPNDYEFGPFD